jgi:hypothetical protein
MGRFPWAIALTVPRLTPKRKAIFRCERLPSSSSRCTSSTIANAIIFGFSLG